MTGGEIKKKQVGKTGKKIPPSRLSPSQPTMKKSGFRVPIPNGLETGSR